MQRAKITVNIFTDKEPEVVLEGQIDPNDIGFLRYQINMAYLKYGEKSREGELVAVAEAEKKAIVLLKQAEDIFKKALEGKDYQAIQLAAKELLKRNPKSQEAQTALAMAVPEVKVEEAGTVMLKPGETPPAKTVITPIAPKKVETGSVLSGIIGGLK